MTPAQALARLGAAARGLRVTRRLHRAITKESYLAERRGERFVLRIDGPGALHLGLDRRAEARILRLVHTAGVGPELVAASFRAPAVLLLRYLPGRAWTGADLSDRQRLGQLAGLLRRVHAIRVPGPPLDFDAVGKRYQRLARARSGPSRDPGLGLKPLPPGPVERLSWERPQPRPEVGDEVPPTTAVSLCHHDPIAPNIIGLRTPRLIDWEYAAGGDPLFDLAAVIGHHRLRASAAQYFLQAYFGSAATVPRQPLAEQGRRYARIVRLWEQALGL